MSTPAFRYIDGALVPCDWGDEFVRVALPGLPPDITIAPPYTPRERRKIARAHGRRRAVAVSRWKPEPLVDITTEIVAYRAHLYRMSLGRRPDAPWAPRRDASAWLCLLDGEKPTDAHRVDMERAMLDVIRKRAA